jgi:DNA-binding CsgD family transcriptional regulator
MPVGPADPLHMFDMGLMGDATEGERPGPLRALLVVVLMATIVGGAIDLYLDAPETWWSAHVIFEIALIALAVATSVILWTGWWRSRRKLAETRQVLETHAAERAAWRASAEAALTGFARAVDERFAAWALTPTEREVALRLLKGHSHKQIAFETGRGERTVRQHAVAVYQKSGLGGRAELAAFFLDDLLLPASRAEAGHSAPEVHARPTA